MIAPLTIRQRAERRDTNILQRLDTVVPGLMERNRIDAWVLVAREYNEDPVVQTMLPSTWLSARRRTIVVFTESGRRRHAVARYGIEPFFTQSWDPARQPSQWHRVAEILAAADPATVAIDTSSTFALADGLTHSEHEAFVEALPASMRDRLVSAEPLAIGWLETRTPSEIELLEDACSLAHGIIRSGLSSAAITPGVTTTADLEWWFREEAAAANLAVWFHPTVSVQRRQRAALSDFANHPASSVIRAGDLVHVDFGVEYAGMHTDQQQHAYVLLPGETAAPPGMAAALEIGNLAQDLVMAEFVTGRTGNEVLAAARRSAAAADIDATIYTHAIGTHGHAAGPTIGLWDRQDHVPGAGQYPIHPDTAYSIELSVAVPVPEWEGHVVRIMLEEDAWFDGTSVHLLDGRQTVLWLVG